MFPLFRNNTHFVCNRFFSKQNNGYLSLSLIDSNTIKNKMLQLKKHPERN